MSCRECLTGHARQGSPAGNTTKLHGLDVYETRPASQIPDPKAQIVMISDAFGWNTNNIRLLADSYAERTGCRVLVPDFMKGTEAPQWVMRYVDRITSETGLWGLLVKPWLITQVALTMLPFKFRNDPPRVYPRVKQWMDNFRCAQDKNCKVGAVGFCWGGYHVSRLAHGELAVNGSTIIDVAFTAHPSELKLPEDIQHIKLPYSVAIGDVDFAMSIEDVGRMQRILKESGSDSEVVVIPDAKHGFAVRADPNDKAAAAMAEQALEQAVSWFKKYLMNDDSQATV